jgi:hypothetical protein
MSAANKLGYLHNAQASRNTPVNKEPSDCGTAEHTAAAARHLVCEHVTGTGSIKERVPRGKCPNRDRFFGNHVFFRRFHKIAKNYY